MTDNDVAGKKLNMSGNQNCIKCSLLYHGSYNKCFLKSRLLSQDANNMRCK